MSLLKRFVLSSMVALLLFVQTLTYTSVAHAQDLWYDQEFMGWYSRVYEDGNPSELFGERYTAAQVQWIFYSLAALFITALDDDGNNLRECMIGVYEGLSLGDIIPCGLYANTLRNIGYIKEGNTSPLAEVFSPRPISSTAYFRDIAERFHIVPEAKAQNGFGFAAGNVILELWKGARDISYFLLVIIILIMAFMIMFRVKISPQMVITVQSAIPKIVITLLLITFSYAIAGLMIDLMYVVIGVMTTFIRSAGLIDTNASDWGETFSELTHANSIVKLGFAYMGLSFLAAMWAFMSLSIPIIGGVIGIFVWLLIIIILLFLIVKISFMLIKNYVLILFKIAFGPLEILAGALGGGGFGKWLKDLTALLAVYPATGFLFVFAFVLLRGAMSGGLGSDIYPFDVAGMFDAGTSWSPPLTGTEDMNIIWLFGSMSIMMMIPKLPDIIKGAMTGRGFDYGSAIMGEVQGARPITTGATGYGVKRVSESRLPIPGYNRSFKNSTGRFSGKLAEGSRLKKGAEALHKYGTGRKWW